jgi:glycosyltransferase involved in cell wall biosynthesis
VAEPATRRPPVLVIGKAHREGKISFGPEVVVQGVTAELRLLAPNLALHVEPRHVGRIVRALLRRSTRVVHFLSTGRWSLLAPLIRFVLRKQVITTFHGYAPLWMVAGVPARLLQMLSIAQAKAGMAGAQTIVSVSTLLARRTAAAMGSGRHRVIPNGLSQLFLKEPQRSIPAGGTSGPLRLLVVGVGRHKGIEGALEALETLDPGPAGEPSWSLTLVGVTPVTRPYARELKERFARWIDRVSLLDAIPHEAMPALYRRHDVLLLWSSHESFGLVVLEAMACGLIPIVSDRVGAKDLIVHGVNGFVVPLGDTGTLTDVLRRLQERGSGGIRGEALRQTAAAASMRKTAEAYRDLYREFLGQGPRVCFVTNICPPYRVKAFELLGKTLPTRFVFFSDPAKERFWESSSHSAPGQFDGTYIAGLKLPWLRSRLVPGLYGLLLRDRYDVLVKCINGRIPLAFSFVIARLRGKRFVLWTGLWHYPSTAMHRLGRPIVRFLYRHSDAIVVYGSHVRTHLLEAGVRPERTVIAPQAVDNAQFGRSVGEAELESARTRTGCVSPVILFVGRLEDHKGLPVLIRACTRLTCMSWSLVIIGEGEKRSDYEQQVTRLGLRTVRFLGHVDNHRLPAFYRLAAVLVLPSVSTREFREPWGLVTNEAFNQGCPVIVTNTVGAAAGGMVEDGVNGFIVEENSEEALASALDRILEDVGLRARLGDAGRLTVQEWTHDRMVGGFLEAIGGW